MKGPQPESEMSKKRDSCVVVRADSAVQLAAITESAAFIMHEFV